MHYKNGRPAKNGDKVVMIAPGYASVAGILYDAVPGNDSCNGRIAITTMNDPHPDLRNVLHVDDIAAANVPDSSAPPAYEPPASTSAPVTGTDGQLKSNVA